MPSRPFWIALGLAATGCGIAGAFLPLVPTTPFLLVASYAFARSSPRLEAWLHEHPRLGPVLNDWRRHRSIRPRVKASAVAVMLVALAASWLAGFPAWVIATQAAVLGAVAAFILTRPDGPAA